VQGPAKIAVKHSVVGSPIAQPTIPRGAKTQPGRPPRAFGVSGEIIEFEVTIGPIAALPLPGEAMGTGSGHNRLN
jgi:hypothetical protein